MPRGRKVLDLTGMRQGMLTVLSMSAEPDRFNRKRWLCRCDCGIEKIIDSRHIKNRKVRSCGCIQADISRTNGMTGAGKLSGAKSHLYNSELTDEHRIKTRNIVALRLWKKEILKRDNFLCQICNTKIRITAHHLNSWAKYPEQRFEIDNGITLCFSHHKEFHDSIGGSRHPCTKKQFFDFVEQRREGLK